MSSSLRPTSVDRSLKRTSSGGERCRAKRIQTGNLRKTWDGKLRRSSFLLSTGVRGCTYLGGQSGTWSLWNNSDMCSLSLWHEWEQQKPGRQGDSIVKMLQICGADGISHFGKEEREDHDKTKETIGHRSTCAGDWRAPAESWCDAIVVLMVTKKLSTLWETQRNRSQYMSQWCNGLQWPPHIVENQRRRMCFFSLCYRSGHGAVFSSCDIQHCFGVFPILIEAQDISGILRQLG